MSLNLNSLSIVTTVYYSEATVEEFYRRMAAEASLYTKNFEIIFVNDGSPDGSIQKLKLMAQNDQRVKVIDLSRNFGHHRALMTGLSYAKNEYVFMLDVDLEEEPEWLSKYILAMSGTPDIDAVHGRQKDRKGNFFEKLSGHIFYKFFNILSDVKVPDSIVTARLMTRKYVTNLVRFQEREIFIAGLCILNGFKTIDLYVDKKSLSKSTYSLSKKFSLLVNGITSLSSKPLYFIFYLGLIITALSFLFALLIFYRHLNHQVVIDGWTSISMLILLLGGFNIFSTGIIGIYLSKIFIETKKRPYNIVRQEVNFDEK